MYPTITLAEEVGYIFEGNGPGSFCFVPAACVHLTADRLVSVDEIRYFRSGWALRNMRSSAGDAAGTWLFPRTDRVITDFASAAVQQFLVSVSARTAHPFPPGTAPGS